MQILVTACRHCRICKQTLLLSPPAGNAEHASRFCFIKILGLLAAGKAEQFFETEGYEARGSNVMRMIGYFSLVGLQRVHALIGDYHTALAVLAPIQPFQKTRLFTQKISGVLPLGWRIRMRACPHRHMLRHASSAGAVSTQPFQNTRLFMQKISGVLPPG